MSLSVLVTKSDSAAHSRDLLELRLDPNEVVAFARAHGRDLFRLSKIEFRTWAQRLEIEMGLRDLPDFEHDIPSGRTADERKLIYGIVFLFQCREGWAPDNAGAS